MHRVRCGSRRVPWEWTRCERCGEEDVVANWVASREGSGRTGKESGREGCHAVGNGLAVHGSDALGMRCKAVHRARECVRRVSRAEGARAAGIAARGGPPYFFRVAE